MDVSIKALLLEHIWFSFFVYNGSFQTTKHEKNPNNNMGYG